MDEQYTYKMQELLNCDCEWVIFWMDSGWLNEIEIIVLSSLLALAED